MLQIWEVLKRQLSTVELHLSGLIGTVSYPDMQKMQIIGFVFKIVFIGSLKFGCCYLQYVPASKSVDHTGVSVLEAITLYCTWTDNHLLKGKLVL